MLPTIPFPVERGSKRKSACFCIRGDGRALKPYVIVERVPGDEALHLLGYRPDNVHLVYQPVSFMTGKLFMDRGERIFL
jgi:hypothetical protein